MAFDRPRYRLSQCLVLFTALFASTGYAHAEAYDQTPTANDYAEMLAVASTQAEVRVFYIRNHEQEVAIIETDPGAAADLFRSQGALFIDTSASGGLRERMDRAARWRGHKRE